MANKRIAAAAAAMLIALSSLSAFPAYAEPYGLSTIAETGSSDTVSDTDTVTDTVPDTTDSGADSNDSSQPDDSSSTDPQISDISQAEISPIADAEYTGKPIEPEVTVTYDGVQLEEGVDYNIEYADNTQIGTASVTIIGIGRFIGSVTVNFNIIESPELGEVTGLKASNNTTSGYTISWNAVKGANGYELYEYNPNTQNWDLLTSTTLLKRTVAGKPSAAKTYYCIRAYRNAADGTKKYSEYTRLYTATLPETTASLKTASVTTSGYTLKWSAVKGADSYNVYLYLPESKSWKLLKNTSSTSYKMTDRNAGQKNTYRVAAVVKAGDTQYEGAPLKKRFTTKPKQVKNFSYTVPGKGYITFKWSKVENANKYQLYYATEKDGKYTLFKEVGKTKTSVKTSLMPSGKKLYFKMRAVSKVDECTANGKCSSKISGMTFNKKSINSIMNSYSNSRSVKQVNAQGYKLSSSRSSQLYNALNSLGGDAGYILYDIDSGSTVAYNANTYFGTASTVKMPYLLYCFRQMEDGSPDLDTVLTYQPSDYNGGSSWIKYQPFYTKYTIRRVIELIGDYSDNCGYYMMQDKFGYDGYNNFIKSLGCTPSVNSWQRWGYVSACDSAREWNNMWDYFKKGKYRTFAKQVFSTSCAANIRDQLGNRYTVYEKSGWTDSLYNETALVSAKHPYIVICLSNRTSAQRMRNVAEISESIHNDMWKYYDKVVK